MTVSTTDIASASATGGSVNFELTLPTPATGKGIAVAVVVFDDSAPSAPTARIEEVQSLTEVQSYSVDRGSSYTTDRYVRLSFFWDANTVSGAQTIFVSKSGATSIHATGYACAGVEHLDLFSDGYGSGTTYCNRTATAGGVGSMSIVAATMHGVDAEIVASVGYSGTTIDLINPPPNGTRYPSFGIGHDHNAAVTVNSGFSWSGQGNAYWWITGIILDVASVSYYQLDGTGATVNVTGGDTELIEGVVLDGTGATVEVTGGPATMLGPNYDYFCDPYSIIDGDGSSWENPFQSMQHMISHMSTGDRGFVKAGNILDCTALISMPEFSSIYGGFNRGLKGTDAPIESRQWRMDQSVIDMEFAYGTSTPWGCIGQTFGVDTLVDNVTIDGFYFKNCDNQMASREGHGGAIRIDSAENWKVMNCEFVSCTSRLNSLGGAIAMLGMNKAGVKHQIVNCRFYSCSTTGNTAGWGGGAIGIQGSGFVIANCEVLYCHGNYGGGIHISGTHSSSTMQDCLFLGCDAAEGSAMNFLNIDHDIYIKRCHVIDSTGSHSGISIEGDLTKYHYFDNCIVVGGDGDGIGCDPAGLNNLRLVNCTIAYNEYIGVNFNYNIISGGALYIYNSIIWGNTSQIGSEPATACEYSDIEGGYTGTGNINVDPMFAGVNSHEPYSLGASTACVDGGNASVSGYEAVDITGFSRTGTPDMGAIEYFPTVIGTIDCSRYHLDMSSKNPSGDSLLRPANFMLPYLLQPSPPALMDLAKQDGLGGIPCYPVWMGAEIEIESVSAYLVEQLSQGDGSPMYFRGTYGPGTGSGQPSWSDPFPQSIQSDQQSDLGNSYTATLGRPAHGSGFSVYNQIHQLQYSPMRYAITHQGNSSTADNIKAFNIWLEGHPQIDRDIHDYCAKWLDTDSDVSEADFPVSSGLMMELVRLLNALIWEARSPLSVPVFGIYWISRPYGPVI